MDKIFVIVLAVLLIFFIILMVKLKRKGFKFTAGVIASFIAIFICIYIIKPLFTNLNYGLDLQGGFEVLYEVNPIEEGQEINSDMVYNTYKAILKRIDILGVSEPEITIEGDNHIRVRLAGVTNVEEARETISSTAVLSFRDAQDNLLMTSSVLGGNAKVTTDQYGKPAVSLSIKDKDTFYDVTNKVKDMNDNVIVIWLDYDPNTDSYIKEKENCGSLNNSKCLSAASVNEAFASDVIIQGNFDEKEAQSLVELINSGALPTKLVELSSRTTEATYGANSLNATVIAGVVGVLLVMAIMMFIYRFAGFIASVNILVYTILSFLLFYLIGGVLTLPGIAAMLLGIGMAVDANVISYERIKEKLRIGKSLEEAYELGNKQSFTSIIDANLTTVIAAIILFIFGQSSVKGFATMLIINIIVTICVMVFLSRFILKLFVKTKFFDNKLGFFIGFNKKKIVKSEEEAIPFKKIDFYKDRKKYIGFAIVVLVVGLAISIFTGFNLGVDFTGGTNITVNTTNSTDINLLKEDLESMEYTIKKESKTDSNYTIIIDDVIENEKIDELTNHLKDEYNLDSDIFVVSQVVKQELTKNAIYSLILSAIGIAIYVSIRFKFNYAISSLVALMHDVAIVILFFGITNLEVSSILIAAILTIIGYSINATIVTFDMIRSNYSKFNGKKVTPEILREIVNNSVRQTLTRSILTTLTTIVPVLCLMLFGAYEILNFNIALFVGFIAGLYSSVFISNQLWLYLETKKLSKPAKPKKKIDEVEELQIKGINC